MKSNVWPKHTIEELIRSRDIIEVQDGNHGNNHPKTSDYVDSGIPFILAKDLVGNTVDYGNCFFIKEERANRLRIGFAKPGDMLLSHKGTVGEIAIVPDTYPMIVLTPQVTYYRANHEGRINTNFLIQIFQSSEIQQTMQRWAAQSTRYYISITQQKRLQIIVPPIHEQKAISNSLGIWDLAIQKTEKLTIAKEKYFKFLVNKAVNANNHQKTHVRDVAIELSVRNNGEQCNRVLSVTNIDGFVLPENQFERRVASEDLSNYKLVRRGQYAYNPSRINVGSIARLDDWPEGVLSPMYVVFSLDESKSNSDFFLYWLSSYEARERIKRSAQGSVRETVGFQSFGDIAIPLPPLDTQLKIAELLNIARKEIDLLKIQLEALRKQKRGLMQKLLTGEWRVKTATEEE